MGRAKKNRAVAETLCNERSSRSHSVFQLKVEGAHAQTGTRSDGQLNLIDLAVRGGGGGDDVEGLRKVVSQWSDWRSAKGDC
jgi:kinesin family member C1